MCHWKLSCLFYAITYNFKCHMCHYHQIHIVMVSNFFILGRFLPPAREAFGTFLPLLLRLQGNWVGPLVRSVRSLNQGMERMGWTKKKRNKRIMTLWTHGGPGVKPRRLGSIAAGLSAAHACPRGGRWAPVLRPLCSAQFMLLAPHRRARRGQGQARRHHGR